MVKALAVQRNHKCLRSFAIEFLGQTEDAAWGKIVRERT